MRSKNVFISHSDQDHLTSLEYRRILSEYDKTKAQHEQVVKQFTLVNFFSSFLESFFVNPQHIRSEVTPVEIYSGTVYPYIEELQFFAEPIILREYRSHSWLSFLFDFGHSLYIEGKRLYRKLRKLKSQLKYFFCCCKTYNFLFNRFHNTCIRIHAMMISDKSGEDNILSKIKEWKEVLSNQFNYHFNGKETYSKHYT